MSILTIVLLLALLLVAVLLIIGGVYYEVVYKPKQAYSNINVSTPAQGSLITPENGTGTTTTT